MRDVREQIGYALTAHGVPLELGIRSTGIEDILSGLDWAHACALIGPRRTALLWAKYRDDDGELRKAKAYWLQQVIEYAHLRAWRRPRSMMLYGLSVVSLAEHITDGERCPVCNGRKSAMVGDLKVICQRCDGRGRLAYDVARYCEEIGCRREDWDRVWRARVDWARRALWQWEADAAQALREVAE